MEKSSHLNMKIMTRDCAFRFENIYKIFDFYVAVHFIAWILAALIIRDYYILHIWSVLDELIELTLKDIRPLFAECWWDSVILDILLANTLGIYLRNEMHRMAWLTQNTIGLAERVLLLLETGKFGLLTDIFKIHMSY